MNLDSITQKKINDFHKILGHRFKTIEVASPNAPITILAKDNEDKEYYIYIDDNSTESVKTKSQTGIKIDNKHFYHLYGMMSEQLNCFWFDYFNDGFILFYLNDCLTPEQLRVTDEFTMIGVASALHIEEPKVAIPTADGNSYYVVDKATEPVIIGGSLDLAPKAKVSKRKK